MPESTEPLLEVRDLRVSFRTEHGLARAVDGISFTLEAGQVLGIVGESGSGKSVSMMAVMRLIHDPNAVVEGEVRFRGRDLMRLPEREMRRIRGGSIALVFQDPMTSLTPVYTVGWQIAEQLRTHQPLRRGAARARAIELLGEVGIPNPERRVDDYPHQFSGGMRQRVMIAMALSCRPALLIADEPTTALDVTIQAQILDLMQRLRAEYGSSILLITHDMGVISEIAERVVVMYGGRVVEEGPKHEIFLEPRHPYTLGLLGSIPRIDRPRPARLTAIPGAPLSLLGRPPGCPFGPRCAYRHDACLPAPPPLVDRGDGHRDACLLDDLAVARARAAMLAAGESA